MRVVVLNTVAPFVRGGAELLAESLVERLTAAGHEAALLRVPFAWHPLERVYDAMLACGLLALPRADRVIALKFPAYLVPCPDKTIWLLHQFRQVYDLWGPEIAADPAATGLRAAIKAADEACFDGARRMLCNSPVTRDRLACHNGRRADVLPPPLNDPELFQPGPHGDYLFAGGRINAAKRQHLLVEAMRHVGSGLRLVVAGPPDTPADGERLVDLVARHRLGDRVRLELGFVPRARIAELVRGALACAYLPIDEDSFGYVAMEACEAAKALLSAPDAGGVLGLVRDGETGHVVSADPEALADVLDRLWTDRATSIAQGRASRALWRAQGIDWHHTIETLLA
ncbi:MAG: glycosyltransferase family 4 protein [Planctomycetota bacterium]